VRLLLESRGKEVRAVVDRWLEDFARRRVPARMFARTETLGDTLEAYREKIAAGVRSPAAAYELATAASRIWQPGDQISYYVAGRGVNVTVNEQARLLSEWSVERPDENVEYYQGKVAEIWARFRPFAENEGLRPPLDDEPSPQLDLF